MEMIEQAGSAEIMRENIDLASEFVFLGLRMEKGIDLSEYRARFGHDLTSRYNGQLAELAAAELIESTVDRLRLTRKGKLFSNEVFAVFV